MKLNPFDNFQKRSSTDIDNEDGEVDKSTYDASKFIEYPGFNAPIPAKFFDVRLFCIFDRILVQKLHFSLNSFCRKVTIIACRPCNFVTAKQV